MQAPFKHRILWSLTKRKITVNFTPLTMMSFVLIVIICMVIPIISFNFIFKNDEFLKSRTKFILLEDLKQQANAEIDYNTMLWHNSRDKFDIELTGKMIKEERLVKTIKGNYYYILHKFSYKVEKVLQGKFAMKDLTFFMESSFPTPESHIILKSGPWPFWKDNILKFKIRNEANRFLIVSIEW
jgi:hypothetical protein